MSELLTVKEFAKAAGVTRQTIYNRLDKDLTEYLTEIDSVKYIDTAALQLFKSKFDSQIDSQIDSKIDTDLTGFDSNLTQILQQNKENQAVTISTLNARIDELTADKERLLKEKDELKKEKDDLTADNKELQSKYDELDNKYKSILESALSNRKQLKDGEKDSGAQSGRDQSDEGQTIIEQPARDTHTATEFEELKEQLNKLQAEKDQQQAENDRRIEEITAEHNREMQEQQELQQELQAKLQAAEEKGIKAFFKRIFGKGDKQ